MDVETDKNIEYKIYTEGETDIYVDLLCKINGGLWRLWGMCHITATFKDKAPEVRILHTP